MARRVGVVLVVGILAGLVVPGKATAQSAPAPASTTSAQDAFHRGGEALGRKDYPTALAWFRKAADQGFAKAQYNLGLMYELGDGVARDYAQAMIWYRKAADQGLATAQYEIGHLYNGGHGVARDYAQAMIWYRKAADQGDASAQNNIGFMYADGRGVGQDYQQAMIWYRKAADQGDADAQYNIAGLYERGEGVPMDIVQATAWYRKAVESGSDEAKTKLAEIQTASSAKAETLDLVCRNARATTLISVDPASRSVRVQGAPTMEFKEGKKYHVTVTDDLIEFGCRKTLTDVDIVTGIVRSGAGQWFDDKKSAEKSAPTLDLACMSKHRIDRRTGIWTASRSTVAGPQSEVSECSLAAKRKLDAGQSQVGQALVVRRSLVCSADFMQLKPGASGARMDDFAATPLTAGTVVEIIGDELRGSIPIKVANGEVGSVNAKAFEPTACPR